MILLKITNASEVVASRLGKFLGSLAVAGLDESTVEDILVRKLVENLHAEGLQGEVLVVTGLDAEDGQLVVGPSPCVRQRHGF